MGPQEHHIHDASETEYVHRACVGLSVYHLWSNEILGSNEPFDHAPRVVPLCQSQVTDSDLHVEGDKNVLGFEIVMNDSFRMQVCEICGDSQSKITDLWACEPGSAAKKTEKVLYASNRRG